MRTLTDHVSTGGARLVAGLTFLVAVGLPTAAILTANARDTEVTPGAGDWVLVGLVGIATGATFALLVPWSLRGAQDRRRALRSGLTLSITGFVLSFVVFGTMVPVILGSAGAWLGYVERERAGDTGHARGAATTAIVLGAVAAIASVAAYVATS